jgi:hypothetical protein
LGVSPHPTVTRSARRGGNGPRALARVLPLRHQPTLPIRFPTQLDPRLEEGAIDDQLTAALEQVERTGAASGAIELVVLRTPAFNSPNRVPSVRM